MKKIFYIIIALCALCGVHKANAFTLNTGKVGNTVCFVRFADEDATVFNRNLSFYERLFNTADLSVRNYFLTASYGQLDWTSQFVAEEGNIISYQAQHNRSYYYPYDASAYPDGYADATAAAAREQALVREIAQWLTTLQPQKLTTLQSQSLDMNGDNLVDNLCIVISGNSGLSSRYALWPHRSDLALPAEKAIYIGDKKLVGYLMVFDGANGYSNLQPITLNTGVLCHEMSHSLGTYDLYHTSGNMNPVGVWDLMSDNQREAQQMSAYTKWRYCKWIDEIPELKDNGTYSLHPMAEGNGPVAYKILPKGKNEYFIVEYRKKTAYDRNLPSEGLIVYRINPAYSMGNVNYNGTTRLDEMYVLRPGGSQTSDGNISNAAIAQGNTYNALGTITPEAQAQGNSSWGTAFYQDGTAAPFTITNVSAPGETITFTLTIGEVTNPEQKEDSAEVIPDNAILYDDFEDTTNPNGWTSKSTGDRGWRFQEATNYYKAYAGNYTATVYYAWDDIHQDEYLTSQRLAGATRMTFQSRSNACGSSPKQPQYYLVEVSSDGGSTWNTLYNVPTDCAKEFSGKYTLVDLDLSQYTSNDMYVRFHCYDTSNTGLSYYWSIDNVCIMADKSDGIIEVNDHQNYCARKVLKNGRIIIQKNGKTYDAQGVKVK